MTKIWIKTIFIAFCCTLSLKAANDFDNLKQFVKNMAAYNSRYTQEKVYLHLDNNGYFPNEKIWYKAYVFKAGTLLPTNMSKVLYVELVTPTGEVKERQILPIYNGRTYGNFSLEKIFQTGYYEIRAYTRAMLNWDPSYIYSRVFPIFNVPEDTTQFTQLSLFADPIDEKLTRKRPIPTPLLDKDSQKEGKLILTFYPEGGHLTKGLPGRVAYKLTDDKGCPFSTLLTVSRADGRQVQSVHPLHEGMGLIELPADWPGGFIEAVDGKGNKQKFNLPQPQESGCQMEVESSSSGNIFIKIASHNLSNNELLGVSTTCRGELIGFDTLKVAQRPVTITLPRRQLHDGIHQITLFTPEGNVLAERLVWVEPRRKAMSFEVKQNQEFYKPFSPVVLNFTLKDDNGKPLQSEFSLSVQDVNGMVASDGMNLQTDMLLCSDLKGYIHQPEYYFEKNDDEHRQALNLLLMVQGWRRYEWKQMAGVDSFIVKQPAEDAQILDGKIADFSKKHNGKAGLDVNLVLLDGSSFDVGTTKTDSAGNFAMKFQKELYGDNYGYFTITKEKDKRVSSDVMLNRTFRPTPLAYEPQELYVEKPQALRWDVTVDKPETFKWKDTLTSNKIHVLPPAKVTGGKLSPFTRYELNSEKIARDQGVLFYNVEDEMEQVQDNGTPDMLLWDWLKQRNGYFNYEFESSFDTHILGNMFNNNVNPIYTMPNFSLHIPPFIHPDAQYILRYHHKKVALIVDGSLTLPYEPEQSYLASEAKSLVISKFSDHIDKLYPQIYQNLLANDYALSYRPDYIFFITTHQTPKILTDYRKGVRATLIHGYSQTEDFYSPNYRDQSLPDPADMRRTLYWNPTVETDKDGKANVILFSNSRPNQQIHINAQGIAVNGKMFSIQTK